MNLWAMIKVALAGLCEEVIDYSSCYQHLIFIISEPASSPSYALCAVSLEVNFDINSSMVT